jgi:hypothetical protein
LRHALHRQELRRIAFSDHDAAVQSVIAPALKARALPILQPGETFLVKTVFTTAILSDISDTDRGTSARRGVTKTLNRACATRSSIAKLRQVRGRRYPPALSIPEIGDPWKRRMLERVRMARRRDRIRGPDDTGWCLRISRRPAEQRPGATSSSGRRAGNWDGRPAIERCRAVSSATSLHDNAGGDLRDKSSPVRQARDRGQDDGSQPTQADAAKTVVRWIPLLPARAEMIGNHQHAPHRSSARSVSAASPARNSTSLRHRAIENV